MSPTFVMFPSVTLNEVTVVAPAPKVPVVIRFSSPKLIAPLESVIEPFPRVRVPTFEPEIAVKIFPNSTCSLPCPPSAFRVLNVR